MTDIALDPRLTASSLAVADLPLCHVRLHDDSRWPWLVLIPRVAGVTEIEQLTPDDRFRLVQEAVLAGRAVRAIGEAIGFRVAKLNVGALGNVVPQLHVHVVGRRPGDPAWPGPVWGVGVAQPYASGLRDAVLAASSQSLERAP